jgi:hypothetical protein
MWGGPLASSGHSGRLADGGSTGVLPATRRDILGLPVALALPALAAEPFPSLRDAAAARGLRYGSDSDAPIANEAPAYAALFERQCALYAPWLSWKRMSPEPGG